MYQEQAFSGLKTINHALIAVRAFLILGAALWLALQSFPSPPEREHLFLLFVLFIVYSVFLIAVKLRKGERTAEIHLAAQAMDLVFLGLFVADSGGMTSDVYIIIYLFGALNAYYYGLARGLALAAACSLVYMLAVYGQWHDRGWVDLFLRLSALFLITGFVGFVSEKSRLDRREIERTRRELKEVRKKLKSAYANLRTVKSQIAQTEKLASVGKLAADIAHEINNPLDGIKNCLNTVRSPDVDRGIRERYFDLMEEGLCDIEKVVRNLLEHVRNHEFRTEIVDINSLLRRTVQMMEWKLDKQGIRLVQDFDPELRPVAGDPHNLQQVYFNIFLNALEAMEEGGTITIRSRSEGGMSVVSISDTGKGMDGDELKRIFEPFYTTKPGGEGTGLGLSICHEIVEKHGGSIDVESRPGRGTTFTVSLRSVADASDVLVDMAPAGEA